MFAKVLAFFAFLAVAFANPKPDVLTYAAPAVAAPVAYAGLPAYTPLAYSAPVAAPYPYAYPGATYYVK